MFIAILSTDISAPAERYVSTAHTAPLERKNLKIRFSINIALRWSAAIYSVSNLVRRDITCWIPLNHCVKPTL